MFVIPCKFNRSRPTVINLVKSIRKFHPRDEIVVVDSSSDDKSYFNDLSVYDVIIEDINNLQFPIGAYWHVFEKYKRDFYFCLHDSMIVKDNLDLFKQKEITVLGNFERILDPYMDTTLKLYSSISDKSYNTDGLGVWGPIFFIKRKYIDFMVELGYDKIKPSTKIENCCFERIYGLFFEEMGLDLKSNCLFGHVLTDIDSKNNSNWQHPIEKFYLHRE
jgi:hypothetical protein